MLARPPASALRGILFAIAALTLITCACSLASYSFWYWLGGLP